VDNVTNMGNTLLQLLYYYKKRFMVE
jgi:hypothetical protein